MRKLLFAAFLAIVVGTSVWGGLPPTTSKGSGDSSNVTTFNFQFPNFTPTHTGITTSFDLPNTGPGVTSCTNCSATIDTKGRVTALSSGAGVVSTANIEQLLQKLEYEKAGHFTEALDNSLGVSGAKQPFMDTISGVVLKALAGSETKLNVAWGPIACVTADPNLESATSWAAVGNANTLAASAAGGAIAGNNYLSYNKTAGGTESGIRFDQAAQTKSFASNYIAYFWINIPSLTNLTDAYIKIFADTTSNFRKWAVTKQADGTNLATGWNLIRVDLSNTSNSVPLGLTVTTGSTGWLYTQLSRYQEYGVDAGSAQTYTAIAIDFPVFGLDATKFGIPGAEFTLADTTFVQSVIIDAASSSDGVVTLKAGQSVTNPSDRPNLTNSDGSSGVRIERATTVTANGSIGFNSNYGTGALISAQEFRTSRTLRESKTLSPKLVTDWTTPQMYPVNTVGGSTIGVTDVADQHLNLLSGDTIELFHPVYDDAETKWIHYATYTLTANSTASGGTTTLTPSLMTGIAVNDLVVKRSVTTAYSFVTKAANESFTTPSRDAVPNGVQIVDNGMFYPNPANVLGHFPLGGASTAIATTNKNGALTNFGVTGSLNLQDTFKNGAFSLSGGFSNTNYFENASSLFSYGSGANKFQFSIWVYFDAVNGTTRTIMSSDQYDGANYDGFSLQVTASANTLTLQTGINSGAPVIGTFTGVSLSVGWNHVLLNLENANSFVYINGVKSGNTHTGTFIYPNPAVYTGSRFIIGSTSVYSSTGVRATFGTNLKFSELIVWKDGAALTSDQVLGLYNSGNYRQVGYAPAVRDTATISNITGQRLSIKGSLIRSTNAVAPVILKTGVL